MKELYVLVSWPEIQDFMEHERWEECIFCQEIVCYMLYIITVYRLS